MLPHSTLLTTLALLSTLSTAIPTTLNVRGDDHPTGIWTCGPACAHTVFDDGQATCADNKNLKDFSTTVTVAVRPDCDAVINTICLASDKLAKGGSMTNLAHRVGTCEAHMLFPGAAADTKTMSYDACVSAFQSITEGCMLIGDSSVKNEASVGKQFGARNVMYQEVPTNQNWLASNFWVKTMPGYLMGPPGVWKTDNWGTSKEADDVLK